MSSIRNIGLMIAVAGAIMLGGCQETKQEAKAFYIEKRFIPPPEPLNDAVVVGDPAMDVRQWSPSAAPYVNDAVVAGPTYSPLKVTQLKCCGNALVEPLFFFGNTLYTPFGCFIVPPWSDIVYKSFTAESSYTLMPPLPNGPEKAPSYLY
jgi:hypothetical protein